MGLLFLRVVDVLLAAVAITMESSGMVGFCSVGGCLA